ncbi:hypothetical protein JCM10213_000281 [Rhodosporidiobolus nylandii]
MGVPLPDDAPSRLPVASTLSPPPPPPPLPPADVLVRSLPPTQTPARLPEHTPTRSESGSGSAGEPAGRSDDAAASHENPLLPHPPNLPFDAPESDSSASWTRWLYERRARRTALAAASATSGLPPTIRTPHANISRGTSERLDRLRQSAERLRIVDGRVDPHSGRRAAEPPTPPRSLSPTLPNESTTLASTSLRTSIDGSRQMLEQVRSRLDETRTRISDAASSIEAREADLARRAQDERETRDRVLREQRENLERTTSFIDRLDNLSAVLNRLSDRAAALPTSTTPASSAPSSAHTTPARTSSSPVPSISSPSELETAASASATDSLRHTVRQLVIASRRVSAAIDRHRESVAAASAALNTTSLAEAEEPLSLEAEENVPLLRMDVPLRVSLPQRTNDTSPSSARPEPPRTQPGTSPDPSSLLLPTSTGTFTFTASPRSISPLPPSPDPSRTRGATTLMPALPSPAPAPNRSMDQHEEENYPGERAQLLRIAQLQQDIAARAETLHELRERGREIEREQRRTALGSGGAVRGGHVNEWRILEADNEDEPKDEDELGGEEVGPARGSARLYSEVAARGAEAVVAGRKPKSDAEKRRERESWARCGR